MSTTTEQYGELPKEKQAQHEPAATGDKNEPDYTDEELEELGKKSLEYYQFDDEQFPTPMSAEAFYGIAGEIVTAIVEQSEASPEGILAQFLVGFGNMIGRGRWMDILRIRTAI